MKQNRFRLLAFVFILVALVTLTACKKEPKVDPEVTAIEITSMPDKVDYVEGEKFDPEGLEVKKVMSDDTKEIITDYTIDKTRPLTVNDTVIKITYEEFFVELNITVARAQLTDLEFAVEDGSVYTRTMDFSNFIKYRGVFNNNTYSAWDFVTSEDIESYRIEDNKLFVTVAVEFNNQEYTNELTIPLNDDHISISELLTKEVDGETHYVDGILVAIGTTMSRLEFILWDKDSGDYIGVAKLGGSGGITTYDLDTNGFEIGDQLRIPVKLVKVNERVDHSDSTKLYAEYTGGKVYSTAVVSKGNEHISDKTSAVTITNQDELVEFLTHENRVDNFYKLVKLRGEIRYAYYSGAEAYRFYFDNSISKLADQRIDNVSPVFINSNHYYTTGKKAVELLFGNDEDYRPTFGSPGITTKEIYALFMGGNTYYHQFIILNEEEITDITPTLVETTFEAPDQLIYPLAGKLDLTGGKISYKYDLGSDLEIDLTAAMLDEQSLPNMYVEGEYTVTGIYEGFTFSFIVSVIDKEIDSIVLYGNLEKTKYNHRDDLFNEVLAQLLDLQIKVNYTDDETQILDIIESMITMENEWEIGVNTFRITFLDKYLEVTFVVENTALSVSEFLQQEEGTFDVVGLVVGPASSHGAIELLIKDKKSMDIIGVYNAGVSGSTSNIRLDTDVVNVGDEIIARLTVVVGTGSVNVGKKYGNATNPTTFITHLLVVSSGNNINLDLTQADVTSTSSQEDLVNFLNSPNRFYSYVKIQDVKGITYSGGYRIFFSDEVVSLATQKVEVDGVSASPFFAAGNNEWYIDGGLKQFFNNPDSTKYDNPATTEYTIYALFLGGNSYYHTFVVLDPSWIVLE